MSKTQDPSSLIFLQRQYLLDKIKSIQLGGGLYTLVTDEKTESVLNQVVSKDALLRIVTSIERIDSKRKIQSYVEGIYFVDLNPFTINCMIADVQTHRYKKGHGLFLPLVQKDVESYSFFHSTKFMNNPKVLHYFDNGNNVYFTPTVFHPVEQRVFLADSNTPNSMAIYYNENCADLVLAQVRKAAKAIMNLIVITGEFPLIRFYNPKDSSHFASRLPELIADEVQNQIDNYARENSDYPPQSIEGKPRSILLITDRTLDLYAPLLHEFSYQAMAMDIVESLERFGKYKYQTENERGESQKVEVTLENEDDENWVSLRHLHIIESSELIINKINELIKNNPLMVDRSKATTSSDLMWVVANLKGFDEERRQITLHKTLVDECLDINANRKLAEFAADFEQTCAAGGTSFEGVRNKNLHDDLIVLCSRDDLHINDKIRLVLIYALYRGGLVESDFVKLASFIGVHQKQTTSLITRCFFNLHKLGFPIVKKSVNDKKIVKHLFHTINNEGTYNTSRFGPGVKDVLQNAMKYQLDESWFPYFRDKPLEDDIPAAQRSSNSTNSNGPVSGSLRNPRVKASWAQSSYKVNLGLTKPKQRIFCYVAGGITYSETRSIYELAQATNKDIYIGSEALLKPRDFLIGLQSIDKVKHMEELDLQLFKDLNKPKEAPLHLFETGQPKFPPPVTPQPTNSNGNAVPLHYQKRNSHVGNLPSSGSTDASSSKDKKRSKLKKLFK
ncbi:Sec1-like protein [Hyphopichia burtonii NRRL Y-1933]|uniref:Sec1-like protein n=1 Tax=Hyphopichia burtonii NRRL Y-1933 TaxID=984485 RepID=A0A1E4RGR9_9ASCO|nr:Sec1-like protein [Hyphopichia burtonii NRRL Y-1933]ODV66411.1 Sec1-like protein [Hyphopichia burtonii NRRL Y-1933]